LKTKTMKRISIYFLLALAMMSVNRKAEAQQHSQKFCYRQLTGNVGTQLHIIMNLVKVNDSLYGEYSCLFTGHLESPWTTTDEPVLVLFSGKMNKSGTFRLREDREWPGDGGPIISGKYTDDGPINATWELAAAGIKKEPFKLTDNFPEGSSRFSVQYLADRAKLIPDAKSPMATIKLALLLPFAAPGPWNADSLHAQILRNFPEKSFARGTQDNLLTMIRQDFFNDYVRDNRELYKEMPGASYSWELNRAVYICYNANHRVSYGIFSYIFTGGAHGNATHQFSTVDMKTGKVLGLADLFKPGYEDELSVLLTGKLRKNRHLPGSHKLSDIGYFTDKIQPTRNFYLNENGIGFCYNQYEIAPYSSGITDIFLTNAELKELLKQPW